MPRRRSSATGRCPNRLRRRHVPRPAGAAGAAEPLRPGRRDGRRHRRRGRATSSRRSTSGRRSHIIGDASLAWLALSAFLTLVTVPPQAWRWKLLLRARGVRRRRRVAHPRVLRLVRGRAGAADRRRRRRVADLRDDAPPSRAGLADRGVGRARAGDRRRRDARARRGRASCSRSAITPSAPYLWIEALFVVGTIARRRRRLLGAAPPPPPPRRAAAAPGAGRADRARRLRGHPRLPPSPAAAARRRRRSRSAAQVSRIVAIWAGGRAVGRRALDPALRRARAAALPRHARAVHGQRARRARGVLRQLPRHGSASTPTRRSRPASSSS